MQNFCNFLVNFDNSKCYESFQYHRRYNIVENRGKNVDK